MTKRAISSPTAVGYSRQSRTRQADMDAGRIVSPEMQTDAARAYAASHGWQWDEELTRAAIETNTSGGQSKGDKKRGELLPGVEIRPERESFSIRFAKDGGGEE